MSDALSDISRSNRIALDDQKMISAQIDFLVHPSEKNLKTVYESIDRYGRNGSGYWGESPGPTAQEIKEQYRKRFSEGKLKVNLDDIALFLNNLIPEEQGRCLSELLVISGGDERGKRRFHAKVVDLKDKLPKDAFSGFNLTGSALKEILDSCKVEEKYYSRFK